MKRFFRIFAAVALVCTTLVACEEKFDDYDPAAMESTAQVYFSKDTATTINILGEESVEIPVLRAVNGAGITANITATVDAEYADLFTIPSSVTFADGETSTSLVITFDPAKLTYGTKYPISLQIASDLITDYGRDLIAITLDYPEPFISLGKGTFSDAWNFENTYQVEVAQNSLNPNVFRLMDPYSEGIKAEGMPTQGGPSEYIEFRILKKGEKLNGIEITRDDLIYFKRFNTGYFSSSNGEETAIHPGEFQGMTEANFVYSKVVEWQENGLPGIVEMAPYFYYFSAGGGYNQITTPNIRFVFPGFELKDYSVSVFSNGMQVVDGKAYPVIDAIFGADVAQLQMAILEGHYQNMPAVWPQVPALVEAGQVKSVIVDAVDQTADDEVSRMSIVGAENLPAGIYTAFVYPIDAEGVAQTGDIQAVSFYMNEVAAGATEFDFTQLVLLPSQFPALAGALGLDEDHSSVMMYYETPHYVREWKHFFIDTKSLDDFMTANPKVTLEMLVKANGDVMDLEYINDAEYFSDYYAMEGLKAETSYSVIDYVVDIYGNVFCQRQDVTTAAAPKTDAQAKLRKSDVSLSDDVVLRSNILE